MSSLNESHDDGNKSNGNNNGEIFVIETSFSSPTENSNNVVQRNIESTANSRPKSQSFSKVATTSLIRVASRPRQRVIKAENDKTKTSSSAPEIDDDNSNTKNKYTRQEICTIASLALGNLSLGALYAILAPFFPHEAEKKGVSPSLYGLVFGIFEFGQFIFAPIAGRWIPHLTTQFALPTGLFINAWCTVIFGLLQWSPGGMTYFWCAFTLRFVSSIGGATYFTASFTLISTDFPSRISSLFALTEVCFGLGMIVGPALGGVLFEAGGFSLPFFVTGAFCFAVSFFTFFALKSPDPVPKNSADEEKKPRVSIFQLATYLGVIINLLISFTAFINIGFNDATLEHHLRDFTTLSPTVVGSLFLISGLVYAIATQLWGFLIGRYEDYAHSFVCVGYVLSAASLLLCGPMYPIPVSPSITLVIVAQVLYGISIGSQLVGSFTRGLAETTEAGFDPDDISTQAARSSLYQSSCALGAAVGPAVGGYLMDNWGYEKASAVLFLMQIAMILLLAAYNGWKRYQLKQKQELSADRIASDVRM